MVINQDHREAAVRKLGTVIAILSGVIDSGTLLQGRFLIEDQIGKGGMGAVYRAVDQKFGSQVAIKETFYGDKDLGEAFEREARLLNGLHHPILPHVSDYFTENGGLFLVMEYIDGEDLSELLKRGEIFSLDSVMGWAMDILDGLDYLHSQDPPIIHRDIKPNNLKLTPRGKIVLLDFGMAKETSTSNTFAARSVFGYSRRYSPLEQIEGSGTDVRSDIFSLGASLYHLVTGEPPVDVLARASAIVAGRPDPLLPANSINPEVPVPVAAVLNSALALNPENRFESARLMSDALAQAVAARRPARALIDDATVGRLDEHTANRPAGFPGSVGAAGAEADIARHVSATGSEPQIIKEEDVVNSLPVVDVRRTSTFNARSELHRRLAGILPSSIPTVRIRRPARLSYVALLPILCLCVGLVLYGTYLGFRGDGNTPNVATETVGDTASTPPSPSLQIPEAAPDVVSPEDSVTATSVKEYSGEGVRSLGKRRDSKTPAQGQTRAISESNASASDSKTRTYQSPTADRRTTDKLGGSQRQRRIEQPAFEQPSVSSIEAIMTGIPYEKRRRWDGESWEERRRRRLRRENQQNQYPF